MITVTLPATSGTTPIATYDLWFFCFVPPRPPAKVVEKKKEPREGKGRDTTAAAAAAAATAAAVATAATAVAAAAQSRQAPSHSAD